MARIRSSGNPTKVAAIVSNSHEATRPHDCNPEAFELDFVEADGPTLDAVSDRIDVLVGRSARVAPLNRNLKQRQVSL
jgi:hypothetical protein